MFHDSHVVTNHICHLQKERIKAGLERRKAQGKRLGRPSLYHSGMPKVISELRKGGMSIKRIAKTLEIGISSVYRGLDEVKVG